MAAVSGEEEEHHVLMDGIVYCSGVDWPIDMSRDPDGTSGNKIKIKLRELIYKFFTRRIRVRIVFNRNFCIVEVNR